MWWRCWRITIGNNSFSCRTRRGNQRRYCLLSVTVVCWIERCYTAELVWREQRTCFCEWGGFFLLIRGRRELYHLLVQSRCFLDLWECACISFCWMCVWFIYICEPVAHTQTLHSTPCFSTWPMTPFKATSSEVCYRENVREAVAIRAKGHIGKLSSFSST